MASKYVQELAYQPDYYGDLKVWAYSPSHYYKKSIKENGAQEIVLFCLCIVNSIEFPMRTKFMKFCAGINF